MGYNKDLGTGTIAKFKDGLPYDEYGHVLGWKDLPKGAKVGDEVPNLTNPYGHLFFAVGTEDDFVCFDYADLPDGRIVLHATVNSETGGFIDRFAYDIASRDDAPLALEGMVDDAINWVYEGGGEGIEHDEEGWDQDPYFVVRSLERHLGLREEVKRIDPDYVAPSFERLLDLYFGSEGTYE